MHCPMLLHRQVLADEHALTITLTQTLDRDLVLHFPEKQT
jgi:hypothetical protein